jgi:hypothetical protein
MGFEISKLSKIIIIIIIIIIIVVQLWRFTKLAIVHDNVFLFYHVKTKILKQTQYLI